MEHTLPPSGFPPPQGEGSQSCPTDDQLPLMPEVQPPTAMAPLVSRGKSLTVWKVGGSVLCFSVLLGISAALYLATIQPIEKFPIPTLALEVVQTQPTFFQRLRGQVVSEVQGVPVYKVSPEDVAKGFTAPEGTHVLFQCPDDGTAAIPAEVALGDPKAGKEIEFWSYGYTEMEDELIAQGKKGREVWQGPFYISERQRGQSRQFTTLHSEEFTMAPGRHYYLMTSARLRVSCGDRDRDFLNNAREDLNSTLAWEPGETKLNDADSDEDGITDGAEVVHERTDPLLLDTDDDGLQDGTEMGVMSPHGDTDPTVFIPDADPGTKTSALKADTDGGGAVDGAEDADHNGQFTPGETNPNDPADDSFCGDGKIRGEEACDDGAAAAVDGCSATCTVEDGFTCEGEPSVCARS